MPSSLNGINEPFFHPIFDVDFCIGIRSKLRFSKSLKNFTRFITSIDRLDITQLIASEVVGACPEVLSILAEDEFYSSPEGKIFNDKFVAKVNAAKRG